MENYIFNTREKNKVIKNLEQVVLEDSEFNECYNIYSNSQVESRFLLSPTFMERLKNIQSVFLVMSVDFAFNNGYLYLFLNSSSDLLDTKYKNEDNRNRNGFFEVGSINKTLFDKSIYLKLFRELVSIFTLVHYFKLNEKTGL